MASTPEKPEKKDPKADAATKKRNAGVRRDLEERKEHGAFGLWVRDLFRDSPAFALSAVVHMFVVILLALVTIAPQVQQIVNEITATGASNDEEKIEEIDVELPNDVPEVQTEQIEAVEVSEQVEQFELTEAIDEPAAALQVETAMGLDTAPPQTLMNATGRTTGTGISGRGKASRAALVAAGGGTPGSEEAVGHALKWIAEHQLPNGAWSFNHGAAPAHEGPVNNAGDHKSLTGATAMALLPYLGAGQTHMEGEYKEKIRAGLYYLGSAMKVTPNGGDLRGEGGSLYDHGLCTIALCEAYALTHDKGLMVPAQQAINYIIYAQDPTAGGWRYQPHQPGDTSVVGWQVMALKSGHLAYLQVDKKTIVGAINFLNTAQSDGGAKYGYTGPGAGPATTAVGLLCRMYMGWKKDEPALQRGVKFLSDMGPAKNNMYFNYYATQVLHHVEGDMWKKWNDVMRDQLISTQVKNGSYKGDRGSWTPPTGHTGEKGGRLCETSLCTMTLEIYYRYMPLYQNQANEDEF